MTLKAHKFLQWDKNGRKGKFPAGILSQKYIHAIAKQRTMRPSKRRKNESPEAYSARRQKVIDQKKRAAELLSLL